MNDDGGGSDIHYYIILMNKGAILLHVVVQSLSKTTVTVTCVLHVTSSAKCQFRSRFNQA